ncbi:hypothetical protein, partial [Enterococcus faecalis]|uniref:hypothetical protein n=1 Tax=Enterococcus faecalis TaxID=1351 RepID=UPI00403F3AE8
SCSSAPDVARNILQVNRDEEFEQCSACLICNELDCGKHDAELKVYLQPWKSLLINGEINAALEDFINFVIDKYTSSWLTNIFFKTE